MAKTRRPGITTILSELRRELKSRGYRIGDLAEPLGVAEPTVWRWLRGDGLTLDRLDEICAIADIDMRDLLTAGDEEREEMFTLAQERILAADRGLALVFFAILHGAQRRDIEREFGLPAARLESYFERLERLALIEVRPRGRITSRMRRSVRRRPGGPLADAFERTVKPLFMSMDFGSPDARYVSDMVPMSEAGRAMTLALFEKLRDDIHLIGEQDRLAHRDACDWCGVLMMVRPFNIGEMTSEWRSSGE